MVALKNSEIQPLLKSGIDKFDAILLHGTDPGQVTEFAKNIAQRLSEISTPHGEIIRLTEQDLTATPGRLASEARSLSMFGGRPIIVVKQGPQLQPALFEELLSGGDLAAYIVIEAGNLKRDAKIRKIFETAKRAAAIACYGADSRTIAQLIQTEVKTAGLTITSSASSRLAELLGSDWAVSRAEITKLILYAQSESEITVEHVEAVVGDASAHAFDAAINDTLAGRSQQALEHLDGLVNAGTPAQIFLTLFLSHLQKLHSVLGAIDGGSSFEATISKIRPPVHFRQKDALKAQIGRWRLAEIAAALALAHETLRQARLNPSIENALVSNFILRLSVSRQRRAA